VRFEFQSPEWMERAACHWRNGPKDAYGAPLSLADVELLMFPQSGVERYVKKPFMVLCGTCPVRQECAEYQKATRSEGVWGGEFFPNPAERNEEAAYLARRIRTRPQHTDKCGICGGAFTAASSKAFFCSTTCKSRAARRKK
jgi:hypothetical protein